ncbi:MAG TPA: amidohydrolase [Salegentibacter sp.]|uniref:amidohydrolase n=1 Tax=Salegentibacter sp. TaxID=1903072 RepID=UPI002F936DBB
MNLNPETINELISFRKLLHANPEVSGNESSTAARITAYLQKLNPTQILNTRNCHGIIAVFDSRKPGESIVFRAELDALPITEINDFEHRSRTEGVSHKCGHDGHATILLGLAYCLAKHPPEKGKVALLFQPAEETGKGAAAILKESFFQKLKPDFIFGLHNLPGFPMHELLIKNGGFTASVSSLVIKLKGKTAHAAEPEKGVNPASAVAEILLQMQLWSDNRPEKEDFKLITPVHVKLGSIAYGVSAGAAELHFTLRTWTQSQMRALQDRIEVFLLRIKDAHRLGMIFYYTEAFNATNNLPEAVNSIRLAGNHLGLHIREREQPFKWGEDFGLFTQHFKGAFFGLGAGENCPALHNPDYDFPDALIPTGVSIFYEIYRRHLRS